MFYINLVINLAFFPYLTWSSLEDPLQITGLSDVTKIVNDHVVESDTSLLELGFARTQPEKMSR